MRITYVVFNVDGMGGTSRSAITQANALAGDLDVRLVSITRSADRPHYDIDPRVVVDYLTDVRDEALADPESRALSERESALVPARWDGQFSALTDIAMARALPALDTDVVVTVTPALLAAAAQLVPDRAVLVHQEHRSSSDRTSGLEPLLAFAPRADVVAMLTPTTAHWLRDQLGDLAPEIVVVPNPLPLGFAPRSRLDSKLIVSAGRLVLEKQFHKLVQAFGEVADQLPGWRLRILGDGFQRNELKRQARKFGLYDRVELPGTTTDMASEWAKASIAALTSRAEGFPLVLQEAMAAGVPVVSFDCPSGPREIVEHDVNGLLVAPDSVAGMSRALLQVASDDELRARLGTGAFHTSRQYDARALAERWVGIFADARARRGGLGRVAARAQAPRRRQEVTTAGVDITGITPAQARHAALSAAVAAARSATEEWLVIPAHDAPAPAVVVPMTARDAVLASLAEADLPAYLSLREPASNGWPERRGTVSRLAAELRRGRTGAVFLEPWPDDGDRASLLGHGCGVGLEFWEAGVDGELVSPRANAFTRRIPPGADTTQIEIDGVTVRTLPLMAEPTVDECRFPIDVVYTWVDGNDTAWNDAREQRLATLTGTALTRESSGRARFVSRDELRYSMRSVHLFAPWVRRIHLVTAGQVPDWLDTSHPAIRVVDHREILPPDVLPTFNSHAIETALHHVPDLTEHFVYLNDDVFLGRPVRPEIFFSPSGLFAAFMSPTQVGLDDVPGAAPYLKAAWNNRRLLQQAFGVVTTHNLAHTPHPHRRSVLDEIEQRFAEEVAGTAAAPFRSDTDVSMLSSLAQHYGLVTGTAVRGEADFEFVNLSNSDLNRQLNQLSKRRRDFFCLGDHHDYAMVAARVDQELSSFFSAYFPVAAPWEI
ncbi:stealth conserved region 3 domain-containing protein [Nocardioides sp.]|uniref:stealth conserved region 3 domain-containing protein n=1 Tax=Nocardioides sp. TaxID=35761 RepID=UPI0025DEA4B1|nr:stealth conserved region 3 domain-containing protein [Nocardioides sp.]